MTPRDWPTRLKGCRTSVTGTLRGVLSTPSRIDMAAEVWAFLEADPEFNAGMARARADFDAGRFTPYRHIRPQPPVAAPPRRRGCSFDCE